MPHREPPRTAARRPRPPIVAALVVAIAALVGVVGLESLSASPPSSAPSADLLLGVPAPAGSVTVAAPSTTLQLDGLGEDDGAVPDGVTVFDGDVPAVGRLDPALLGALRRAATAAAADGIEIIVNSGWRSPEYQERLLDAAISKYGSREAAARWVATPETSAHVSGHAIDIGPSKATTWLSRRGTAYGLCQIYRNEPWHFELRPGAADHGCPAEYADPTHDPRMEP
jgi:D-alanyl-D-alanine carboxypeptidase